jgi:hypothetical protein
MIFSIAGYIAQHYDIQNILYLALAGVMAGVVECFFLKEAAPHPPRGSRRSRRWFGTG